MDLKNAARSPIGVGIQAGVVALYPIGRAPRPVQIAFVSIPAAVGAAAAYGRGMHHDGSLGLRVAGAVSAAATLTAAQLLVLRADRGTEALLRRLNVPAPRMVIAMAAGMANAALSIAIGRWQADQDDQRDAASGDGSTE